MCGICGQFNYLTRQPVEARSLERMTAAMVHRGPDDDGYYQSGNLGLGFRRLSIIDLAGGHQPMGHPDGSVWVVFNGEIYNFHELRSEAGKLRPYFSDKLRYGGHRSWLQAMGRCCTRTPEGHVWRRHLGRKRTTVDPGPRQDGNQARLLQDRGWASCLFGSEIRTILAVDANQPDIDPAAMKSFSCVSGTHRRL